MDHLMERYRRIRALYLEACRQDLAEPIELDLPIDVYLQQVKYAIKFAQDGKTPFNQSQMVQTAYHAVNKTGIYSQAFKEWRKKVAADQTWKIFKQVFAEEYHDLVD